MPYRLFLQHLILPSFLQTTILSSSLHNLQSKCRQFSPRLLLLLLSLDNFSLVFFCNTLTLNLGFAWWLFSLFYIPCRERVEFLRPILQYFGSITLHITLMQRFSLLAWEINIHFRAELSLWNFCLGFRLLSHTFLLPHEMCEPSYLSQLSCN